MSRILSSVKSRGVEYTHKKERNDDVKVVAVGERGQTLEFRNGATHTHVEEEDKTQVKQLVPIENGSP
jgi:hypothetical protein